MGSMTRAESGAWAMLAVTLALGAWFQMRMMDGWTIVDQPASELLGVYVVVLAVSTIAAIASAGASGRKGRIEVDERDLAIRALAGRNERYFVLAAVNVLIWQALMEGVFAGHELPKIDLQSLPTLFFVLFAVLFGGEIVRLTSTIWLYRRQSAHE